MRAQGKRKTRDTVGSDGAKRSASTLRTQTHLLSLGRAQRTTPSQSPSRPSPLVARDEDAGRTVVDATRRRSPQKRRCGSRAREERDGGVPRYGELDRDGVTLLESLTPNVEVRTFTSDPTSRSSSAMVMLPHLPGSSASQMVATCPVRVSPRIESKYAMGWTHPIRMRKRPAVDTVIRRIQPALGKPRNIPRREPAAPHSLERAVPVQHFARFLYASHHNRQRVVYTH
jgi:hypothetical protein